MFFNIYIYIYIYINKYINIYKTAIFIIKSLKKIIAEGYFKKGAFNQLLEIG
jgi:hypothetical protein